MIETMLEIEISYTVIWSMIVGLLGVVGGGLAVGAKYFEYKKTVKKEIKGYKRDIADLSRPMLMDLQLLNRLHEVGEKILSETNATRFLILVATNGKEHLRKATVIYEQHHTSGGIRTSIGATGKYVDFEFDSVYMKMLKEIKTGEISNMIVAEMIESDLKRIYDAEGVTHSNVFFIKTTKMDEDNDRLWYSSVATHLPEGLTENDMTLIKLYMSTVKGIFNELELLNE